jgi:uncharacterized protein (TIGR02117 family)
MLRLTLLLLFLCFTGCSLQQVATSNTARYEQRRCASPTEPSVDLYLVNLGWHTGLVLAQADAREVLEQSVAEVRYYPWIEFGWGDKEFYMDSGYSYWRGFKAMFFSAGSVLHVVGFAESPEQYFINEQVYKIAISQSKLPQLLRYLKDTLQTDESGRAQRLGRSLYGSGSFYEARGDFSLLTTCNSWTAAALVEAGCTIDPAILRSGSLMREIDSINSGS